MHSPRNSSKIKNNPKLSGVNKNKIAAHVLTHVLHGGHDETRLRVFFRELCVTSYGTYTCLHLKTKVQILLENYFNFNRITYEIVMIWLSGSVKDKAY